MKLNVQLVFAIGLGVLLVGPAFAHHSFMTEYDLSKAVTVNGIVTKIEYVNPHVNFYIESTDAAGRVTNWRFEAGSLTAVKANGWTRDAIKTGDNIRIEAFRAKNGSPFGAARSITLPNGKLLPVAGDGVPPLSK